MTVPLADGEPSAGGTLHPLVARDSRPMHSSTGSTDVVIKGQVVSALPVFVRVDAPLAHAASDPEKASTLAYRLTPEAKGVPPTATWTATTQGTPGLPPVQPALWIAWSQSSDRGELENEFQDAAARQIAIWASADEFRISQESVPNPKLRKRASELLGRAIKEGSQGLDLGTEPISVGARASIADVEPDQVILSIFLSTDGENSFCEPQKLDVFYRGHWGVVETGSVTSLQRESPTKWKETKTARLEGPACERRGVPEANYNEAQVSLSRSSVGATMAIDWNIELNGPNFFFANDGTTALLTHGRPELEYRQEIFLDPSEFPTAQNYLQRWITKLLSYFHGIFALLVLLALLVLAPLVSEAFRTCAKILSSKLAKQVKRIRLDKSAP